MTRLILLLRLARAAATLIRAVRRNRRRVALRALGVVLAVRGRMGE